MCVCVCVREREREGMTESSFKRKNVSYGEYIDYDDPYHISHYTIILGL